MRQNSIKCLEKKVENSVIKNSESLILSRYIAHRGLHNKVPENSKLAFQLAKNFWGIETDIQVTKDSKWVCLHDDTIDRMTNSQGKVSNKTLNELKKLQLLMPIEEKNCLLPASDLEIPTFEEYLGICKEMGKIPIIEIKGEIYQPEEYKQLVASICQFNLQAQAVLISFSVHHLREIKQRLPEVAVQLIAHDITEEVKSNAVSLGENSGVDICYTSSSIHAASIEELHQMKLTVNLWTTPASQFTHFERLGVDFLTTNSPLRNPLVKESNTMPNSRLHLSV